MNTPYARWYLLKRKRARLAKLAAGAAAVWDTSAYYDDYNAYPNGTRFAAGDAVTNYGLGNVNPGNLNWDAIATGAANASRFNNVIHDGVVRLRTAGDYGDYSSPGSYLVKAPDLTLTGDQYIEVDYIPSAAAGAISFKASNASNHVTVGFAGGGGAVSIAVMNAGVTTGVFSASPNPAYRPIAGPHGAYSVNNRALERFTISIVAGRIYFNREGQPIGDPLGYTFTDPGGSFVGFCTWSTNKVNNVTALRAGVCETKIRVLDTHNEHYPRRLRSAADTEGYAPVTFTGTYTGVAPNRLVWRLIDPETGVQVKNWAYVPSATIGSGNFSCTIDVPCGLNGFRSYMVQFAAVNSGIASRGSVGGSNKIFAVCVAGIALGQSNAAKNQGSSGGTRVITPGGYSYQKADPPSMVPFSYAHNNLYWVNTAQPAGDKTNWKMVEMLKEHFNKPITLLAWNIPAQGAANLDPIDGAFAAYLQQHMMLSGEAWEFAILGQGEAEFTSGGTSWKSQWKTNIAKYLTFNNQYSGFVPPIFVTKTGRNPGNAGAVPASTLAMRLGQEQLITENDIPGCVIINSTHWLGCPMVDGLHYTATLNGGGYEEGARRDGLSILKYYGASAYDGRGPLATTVTRSGAEIRVLLNKNGATSLVARDGTNQNNAGNAAAFTGLQISSNDFAGLLTISSTAIDGDYLVFNLSADPGGPVKFRADPASDPNVSSWPFGLYADGTYIGMEPPFTPLVSN